MSANQTYAITGANGFLGWHVRVALLARGIRTLPISLGSKFDPLEATAAIENSDVVIHLAAVNRGSDEEVREGNSLFASQLVESLEAASSKPTQVIYANSIHSSSGTVYGAAKGDAATALQEWASHTDVKFSDVHLPNLFGEHGRPYYNSVVATFAHQVATGDGKPAVNSDSAIPLLHAQDAADWLIGSIEQHRVDELIHPTSIRDILDKIVMFHEIYQRGEIPDVSDSYSRNLFNTYRSYVPTAQRAIKLTRHADPRGSFFEIVKSHGGQGQSSFSTTVPGVTRGDHFHRRKIERFTVLAGEAEISMRRLFSADSVTFRVTGDEPIAIDMPTGWAHNIRNIGSGDLYTSFWSNELFDPTNPDTHAEVV